MINFRYHIISLTAVFLALGIGIAMGSTVVSKATVSGLRANLRTIEHNSDVTRSENRTLQEQLADYRRQNEALTKLALPAAVRDRLTGVPVVVLASKGIDATSLSNAQSALTDAGARYEGTLLVDKRLDLSGGNATKLATILGIDLDAAPEADLRGELVRRLVEVLRDAAATPSRLGSATTVTTLPKPDTLPGAVTTTTVAPVGTPTEPPLLTALRDAGFLGFEPPDGGSGSDPVLTAAGGGYRYLVVSGPTPELPNEDFLLPLLRALGADGPVPVVVASAATGDQIAEGRLDFLSELRDDKSLDGRISTVDDLDQYPGLLAVVYGLAEVGPGADGRHGHYGVGKGATALVPSVSG